MAIQLAIHNFASYIHVLIGSCALIIFWIPVFTRKGALDHRRYGRWFARTMYGVAGTGLVMAMIDLYQPLATDAQTVVPGTAEAERVVQEVRGWALFLFSLSILVLTTTRHGWLVAVHKHNRQVLRHPVHVTLCLSLLVVGLVLLRTGWLAGEPLMMVFGGFEVFVAGSTLRFIFKPALSAREWIVEHLGSLIGSGIAAYTAFFVFGGTRLFQQLFQDSFATASIFLWLAPGVVGGIAIALMSRKYGDARRSGKRGQIYFPEK